MTAQNPRKCGFCAEQRQAKVVDVRNITTGRYRRYRCLGCGKRWSTVETQGAKTAETFKLKQQVAAVVLQLNAVTARVKELAARLTVLSQ